MNEKGILVLEQRIKEDKISEIINRKKNLLFKTNSTTIIQTELFYHSYWHITIRVQISKTFRSEKTIEQRILIDGIEGSAGIAPALPDYFEVSDFKWKDTIITKITREEAIEKAKDLLKNLIMRKVFLIKDLRFDILDVKLVYFPYRNVVIKKNDKVSTLVFDCISGREDRRVAYYYLKYKK